MIGELKSCIYIQAQLKEPGGYSTVVKTPSKITTAEVKYNYILARNREEIQNVNSHCNP